MVERKIIQWSSNLELRFKLFCGRRLQYSFVNNHFVYARSYPFSRWKGLIILFAPWVSCNDKTYYSMRWWGDRGWWIKDIDGDIYMDG